MAGRVLGGVAPEAVAIGGEQDSFDRCPGRVPVVMVGKLDAQFAASGLDRPLVGDGYSHSQPLVVEFLTRSKADGDPALQVGKRPPAGGV